MNKSTQVLKQLVRDYHDYIKNHDEQLWQERFMANIIDAQQVILGKDPFISRYMAEQYEFDFKKN